MYKEVSKDDPWTWGNTLIYNIWGDAEEQQEVSVTTIKLSSFCDRTVDFIKLDIEGAEEQVLKEIEPKLRQVRSILIEFHGSSTASEVNDLNRILSILEANNFDFECVVKDKERAFRPQTIKRVNPSLVLIRARNQSLMQI